jgi:predicted CoA-binding protein
MMKAITVKRFCEQYDISRTTAYKLLKEKKLESVLVNRCRRITVSSADALFGVDAERE